MIIIRKDVMSDGVKIQLEDWRDNNTEEFPDVYGITIAAYPMAINSGTYLIKSGERFRLQISSNKYANYSDADVVADYDCLVSGQKSLKDLADHFYYGDKDKWFLGMFTPETEEWHTMRRR